LIGVRLRGRSAGSRRAERDEVAAPRRPGADLAVGAIVYRGVTTSEVGPPIDRLAELLRADVYFVGLEPGPMHGVEPSCRVVVDYVVADAPYPDVLFVPGGLGWRQLADDDELRPWMSASVERARAVLAVSTGSLILAASGILDGRDATGHWLADDELSSLGAVVQPGRVVVANDGRVVTAGGMLAALDAAEGLADRLNWSA